MRADVPGSPPREKQQSLQGAAASPVRRGDLALPKIFAPTSRGDGFRHVNVGRSGSGKTQLTKRIIDATLAEGHAGWALILDDKHADHTPYEGATYVNTDAFRAKALLGQAGTDRRAIFRGEPYTGVTCTAEEVAQLAQQLARARLRPLLVLDEARRATTDAGKSWTSPTSKWCLVEGRALGLSVILSGQDAESLPREVGNEATSVSLFRTQALALPYVSRLFRLQQPMAERLGSTEVGQFLLITSEDDEWGIYQFPEHR